MLQECSCSYFVVRLQLQNSFFSSYHHHHILFHHITLTLIVFHMYNQTLIPPVWFFLISIHVSCCVFFLDRFPNTNVCSILIVDVYDIHGSYNNNDSVVIGIHNVKVFSDPVDELCSLFVIFNFII